jgi:DNA-binding SARP family transcriptional activator
MADIVLTVLGGFQLRVSGRASVSLPTKKCRALLAYLALSNGRAFPREHLATLLWGDTPDRQARQNLRYSLAMLRKALAGVEPSPLTLAGETIVLAASSLDVDALEFERLVTDGSPESLAHAVNLYQGELLAGLGVDEPGLDEWLTAERERLHERSLEAHARLLAHQRERQAVEPAIQTALHALQIDPLQEPVHRSLMRLYHAQGRRAAALKQYQVCVGVMRRELGTEPEPETQALYRQMLGSAVAGVDRREPAVRPAEPALLGRAPELARLRRALDAALNGQGQLTLLVGEAGIGKSRLAEELVAIATTAGARVLLLHCHETEQALPFGAWVDGLRTAGVVTDIPGLAGLDAGTRRELARLFLELGEPDRSASVRQEDHLRLFEATARLLLELARREPLVIILEDLHWADDMTVRLLGFVSRRLYGPALMVAGTAREDDLTGGSLLGTLIEELEREDAADLVPVRALSRADTIALGRAVLGRRAPRALDGTIIDELWNVSEGNPFVIVELIRALDDAGVTSHDTVGVPRSVQSSIRSRLERLTSPTRQLAATAAVIGREFDFQLLQQAADVRPEHAAEALEELVRRRVVDVTEGQFRFVHERVREVAYRDILEPRRALLHRTVAAALEALGPERSDEVSDRLAHHWSKAGDDARALHHLVRLAEAAGRRYAFEEAIRVLQTALCHAQRLPGPERDRVCLEVLLRLTEAFLYIGRVREGRDLLVEHEPLVHRVGDDALTATFHVWASHAFALLDEADLAIEHARRSLESATRTGDRVAMGKAHYVSARACYRLGQSGRGLDHARQAIALLEQANEPSWLGYAHWALGLNLGYRGEYPEALRIMTRVRELAGAAGDVRLLAYAEWTSSWSHVAAGDFEAAVLACRRAVTSAPDPSHRTMALMYLGSAQVASGDAASAVTTLEEVLERFRTFSGLASSRAFAHVRLSSAYLLAGDALRAQRAARVAITLAEAARWPLGQGNAHRALGLALRALGASDEGEAHLRQAIDILGRAEVRLETAVTQMFLAGLLHERGGETEAAVHLSTALATFRVLGLERLAGKAEELERRLASVERPPTSSASDPRTAPSTGGS